MCCSGCLSQGSSDPTPPPDLDVVSSGQCHPKRFMMVGRGVQGPQLSRLVSAVGAEEEGGEVTTCVAVISKATSAVPSVSVCKKYVILPTGVL